MAMIKPQFTQRGLEQAFAKQAEKIHKAIIRNLIYLGEQCVTMSRKALNIDPSAFPISYGDSVTKPLQQRRLRKGELPPTPVLGDYKDQTANLRNSIGYVVVANGVVVSKSKVNSSGDALLTSLVSKHRSGYALIVVAGMDYAVHVESKGYNVIASSEKYAAQYMPTIIAKLKKAV